jgi:hypothetical protein
MRIQFHTSLWIGVLLLVGAQARAEEWITRTVAEGRLLVDVPASIGMLSDAARHEKYPAQTQPADILTDPTTAVNFVFSLTAQPLAPAQLDGFRQTLTASIAQRVSGTVLIDSHLVPFGDQQAAMLEFTTPAPDEPIHNLVMIASLDGRMLMVTFNVVRSLESAWLDTGRKVLKSVRLSQPTTH